MNLRADTQPSTCIIVYFSLRQEFRYDRYTGDIEKDKCTEPLGIQSARDNASRADY